MAIDTIDRTAKKLVLTVQDYTWFAYRAFLNLWRPPIYWPEFLIQSDVIGVGSFIHRGPGRNFDRGVLAVAVGGHAGRI